MHWKCADDALWFSHEKNVRVRGSDEVVVCTVWNEDHLPRAKKETKPSLRGNWESLFSGKHTDNVPKATQS